MYLWKRSPDLLLRAVNRGNNSQCQGYDKNLGNARVAKNSSNGNETRGQSRVVQGVHSLLTRKAGVIGRVVRTKEPEELEAVENIDHLTEAAVVAFVELECNTGQVEKLVVLSFL